MKFITETPDMKKPDGQSELNIQKSFKSRHFTKTTKTAKNMPFKLVLTN